MGSATAEQRRAAQRAMLTLAGIGDAIGARIAAELDDSYAGNAPVSVLLHLDCYGPTRPGALRTLLGYTSGGVTRLLDRLESDGLITRSLGAVAGDRRAVVVSLTPQGTRAARTIGDAALDVLEARPDLIAALEELIASVPAALTVAPTRSSKRA